MARPVPAPRCEHVAQGTRRHHSLGLCRNCYDAFTRPARRTGHRGDQRTVGAYVPPAGAGARHAATDRGVAAWTADADAALVAAYVAGPLADLATAATWAEARAWAQQRGQKEGIA